MQKVRDLYKQTQDNSAKDVSKITQERTRKIIAHIDRQIESFQQRNELDTVLQLSWHREKFSKVQGVLEEALQQNYKKSRLETELQTVLKEQYKRASNDSGNGSTPKPPTAARSKMPTVQQSPYESSPQPKPRQLNPLGNSVQGNSMQGNPIQPQPIINLAVSSFLDSKKEQMQRSTIGFKSVIQTMPHVANFKVKQSQPNAGQIRVLEEEINKLKEEQRRRSAQYEFDCELLKEQKRQVDGQVQQCLVQIAQLKRENETLRMAGNRSEDHLRDNLPNKDNWSYGTKANEQYIPYHIICRGNNMTKIQQNNRSAEGIIEKELQRYGLQPQKYVLEQVQPNLRTNAHPSVPSNQFLQQVQYWQHDGQVLQAKLDQANKSSERHQNPSLMLSKSCLLLSNSELTDPAKNLTLRSKLAFFKKSMLLVHHPDFELAFKRSELFDMSLVKLVLYFNNKTSSSKAVSIIYSYDENYYRITVLDKLIRVDQSRQGRQTIQIVLLNKTDLDSIIIATVRVDGKDFQFVIPAMFLEVTSEEQEWIPQVQSERRLLIPHQQFSSFENFSTFISQIRRIDAGGTNGKYGGTINGMVIMNSGVINSGVINSGVINSGVINSGVINNGGLTTMNSGKFYCRSKYGRGYVRMTWSGRGVVEVETRPEWLLLFAFLLMKEEQLEL